MDTYSIEDRAFTDLLTSRYKDGDGVGLFDLTGLKWDQFMNKDVKEVEGVSYFVIDALSRESSSSQTKA
ncbi:hypothetical protein GLOTRDRAFT_109522 [Gloeophyllum trabeum ATCC 11539]|uniref:Uncharacterized protein n=1 Tax=Gloeophyllum trabeum (strain ATCC 11539 / FP-39264 / Madison 617) TaxID=670483 RepID=S7RW18_GLOTA|nr:uncharacterized protein GLOTRDRAFT_109522 [Gloeophyllum trabeum ATCC 11539]EPQ59040.1 hypothetical protein GLOTRDRAFT_109522 [Gloeophyllum trabeum ATCC 11539]